MNDHDDNVEHTRPTYMPTPRPSKFQRQSLPAAALSPPSKRRKLARCLALPPGTRPIRSPSPSFIHRKHGLAAWPSHLGLGQFAAHHLPSSKGSMASLLSPPTWDSANSQPITFLHPKKAWPRCLALPPGTRPIRSPSPSFIQRKHGLAAWPSHLGLGQFAAHLLPSSKGSMASLISPPTWDSADSQPPLRDSTIA
ncbi:hypothetical protein Adt_17947 [Abeliophyllum distichum]|uniref:Uncharacterized protein n=1 Tax=Abeliophyllum distichum TaxID=126358 RepID=A0ABD1THZ1_9LAMI